MNRTSFSTSPSIPLIVRNPTDIILWHFQEGRVHCAGFGTSSRFRQCYLRPSQ
jgi:hypothetical protein